MSLFGGHRPVVFCATMEFHFESRDAVGAIYERHDLYKHEQSEVADYLQVI